MRNVDVFPGGKYDSKAVHRNLYEVLREYMGDDLEAVVIEEQFDNAQRMCRIEGFLAGLFYDKAVVIAPRHLKASLRMDDGRKLATGDYAANKQIAVEFVEERVATGDVVDNEVIAEWRRLPKRTRTDMADALLQVMYYEQYELWSCPESRYWCRS